MHKKKKTWIYSFIIIVIAVIVLLYIILSSPAKTGTNPQTSNNNANTSAPTETVQPSANITKTNLALYYNLDWQKDYVDKPNNLVSIYISGNYDAINVSSQTHVLQVTLMGANNKVTFCNSTYAAPVINKVGINNVINYVVC